MATLMAFYVDGAVQVVEAAPRQWETGGGSWDVGGCWLDVTEITGKDADNRRVSYGYGLTFSGYRLGRTTYGERVNVLDALADMETDGLVRMTINGEQVWPIEAAPARDAADEATDDSDEQDEQIEFSWDDV